MSRSEVFGSATGHFDRDVRVVPGDPRLGLGVVVGGDLVGDVGDLGEHAEAVGETDRDEELAVVLVAQLVALPLP